MRKNETQCSLTQGGVARAMLLFALPIFCSNLFQQLYNAVDSLIVGNFLGGEALAAEYLRKKHYRIEAMNYRTRLGEIDIIASNRQYLVFCEVKLRKSADFAAAREFVDARKQQRLRTTALLYLSQHETPLQPRFDVIEIYAPDGTQTRRPQITHMEDAF